MASFHNWTGDEEIDTQVPQFLNDDNAATQEKLDTKFNNSLKITGAADLNSFKDEGLYYCNSNSQAETILNCPTNYAFGLMVWGKEDIFYQEVREFNRGSNQDYNNCWRRSYYFDGGQGVWSNWQQMSYVATTLAGYGITDGMRKNAQNSVPISDFLKKDDEVSYLRLAGGNTFDKNATLQLYGGRHSTDAGQFLLKAANSTRSATLLGSPSGILKWDNKNIVRSINNITADDNGNVTITVSGGSNVTVDTTLSSTSTNPVQNKAIYTALNNKLDKTGTALYASRDASGNVITTTYAKKSDISGMVKSVNNIKPDSNGNVAITVSGGGTNVTVDTALSETSTNPVQNRVIKEALDGKLSKTEIAAAALKDAAGNIIANTYAKKTDISGFVKTVNGTAPDSAGNVTINVSGGGGGGVSTSESNTWTGKQTFQKMKFNFESYNAPRISGTIDNPSSSVAVYNVQGNFTLDMSVLAGLLSNSDATLFTAYITANGAYTLSITNAGTLKYVGNASDLAITVNGLLLNILLIKSSSGDLSSVVQASALS